jgi:acetyl-CoA hydrolase
VSGFDFSRAIRGGDVVAWPQGPGEPTGLSGALVAQRHELPPFSLLLGLGASRTVRREHADRITLRALNGAGSNRGWTDLADIVPVPISQTPARLRSGALRVDVVLLRVRPSDRPGFYTTGVISDYTQALAETARVVVAELDERLPITGGDALIPTEAVDHVVPAFGEDILMPDPKLSEVDRAIARNVAAIIPDGGTIQLGVGTLPTAVAAELTGHRELGVHSGVVSDVLVDLVERGVVTNARKGVDPGVTITGGLFGTERLRAHADRNAAIGMRASSYTHNPEVLARIHAMYAINSAIEIDLTGQANSELAAGRYLGAVGGQLDFVRGAQVSPEGRSIMALPSTTPDEKYSRIVASLDGRPVTTPRSEMDMVVTEYGVAELRGCGFHERARRLLAIAHPKFRDVLSPAVRQAAE